MALRNRAKPAYDSMHDKLDKEWRQWNMTEGNAGKEFGSNAERSYYKHVLCHKSYPWKRIVKTANGTWIELVQTTDAVDWGKVEGAGLDYMHVPSIGVLSRWPDDEFSVEDMHKRQKYLMLMELIDHCENCLHGISGATLGAAVPAYGKNTRMEVTDKCNDHYGRWSVYNSHFRLGWQDLPTRYRDDLMQDIQDRINNYNDPKSEAKRNRQKARREAVKALMGN